MPSLTPATHHLVKDTCFTAADFVQLQARGQRSRRGRLAALRDAQLLVTRYVDVLDPGIGTWLLELMRRWGSTAAPQSPLSDLTAVPQLLAGQVTLSAANRRHPAVTVVQRAIMALAKRRQIQGYMLPKYGADGDYGDETAAAISTFQSHYADLATTGIVNQATAQTLDQVLRLTRPTGAFSATPSDLVGAAMELCAWPQALNYGVPYPWINNDPFHAVPVDQPFTYLTGRWKCNLFGGNVLRKGGYEPPFYGNRSGGEYPNANQWYKWSDRYASAHGNRTHFQLVAQLQPDRIDDYDATLSALNQMLQQVQPGDFLMQDHPGPAVADGGHTRVAVTNNYDLDGTVAFAQAQYDRATVQDEAAADLLPAENLWLLRPLLKM